MELGSLWVVVLCVFGTLEALQWLLKMDRDGGQTCSAGRSLKQKLKPGFQDQARGGKVLAVEDPVKEVKDLGDPQNLAKGHGGCSSSSIIKGSDPAVQSNSSTTSIPFPGAHRDYDVFLSFRGEDTCKNFTGHLYNALVRVGIHTFRDEEELERGRTICIDLFSAIHRSKISIVVFSKDYAFSSWCLDELVEILHCRKTMGHTLLPIFYHVDPSDVRKQVGSFAEAFVQHEQRFQTKMEKVRRWRVALTEAANCSGWDLQSLANGYESHLIERIVIEVSRIMKPDELEVARHPIGINSCVQKGTKTIKGIISNLSTFEDVHLETQAFTNMKRMRLLQINGVHLTGSYENLPNELRLLCWQKCPLKFLPHNFCLENLVILDMRHSSIEEVWKNNKKLGKLKVLNLKGCKYLRKSPNFFQVPQLEVLILKGCINLVQIHESIGDLKRLVVLDLEKCKKLWDLPSIILNLKALEVLNLSGCLKLQKLPKDLGNMIALKLLLANGTTIEQLPSSNILLENLKTLQLFGHQEQSSESLWSHFLLWMSRRKLNPISLLPTSVLGFRYLKRLNLRGRNLFEDRIPDDLGSLCSLTKLDLSRNNFRILPHSISCLPKLRSLYLRDCTTLQSISRLPASVDRLHARGCTSMERILISLNRTPLYLNLYNCPKLTEIQGLEREGWISYSFADLCRKPASDVWSQILLPLNGEFHYMNFKLRTEIPNWFNHQSNESSISFRVPSTSKVENLRLSGCAICIAKPIRPRLPFSYVIVRNKSRGCKHIYQSKSGIRAVPRPNYFFLFQTGPISNELEIESGDEIEVSLEEHGRFVEVQKWGVHVLVVEPKRSEEHGTTVTNCESNP